MTKAISTGLVHHLALTVANLERSKAFYMGLLGFNVVAELGPTRVILGNGSALMALTIPPDPSQAIPGDTFNENRLGLDHLSFDAGSRAALDEAIQLFDEHGVSHGEVKDLGEAFGVCVLAFRDPDNIQLELTSARG